MPIGFLIRKSRFAANLLLPALTAAYFAPIPVFLPQKGSVVLDAKVFH